MESVIPPPRRTACSQAMLMSIRTQRMSPGRSSLKDLISNEPMRGFSSLPMNHCRLVSVVTKLNERRG